MKRLDLVEERVAGELKNLTEKTEEMEQDIKEKFDKVSVIKDEFEQRRKKYIRDRDDLKNYKVQIS